MTNYCTMPDSLALGFFTGELIVPDVVVVPPQTDSEAVSSDRLASDDPGEFANGLTSAVAYAPGSNDANDAILADEPLVPAAAMVPSGLVLADAKRSWRRAEGVLQMVARHAQGHLDRWRRDPAAWLHDQFNVVQGAARKLWTWTRGTDRKLPEHASRGPRALAAAVALGVEVQRVESPPAPVVSGVRPLNDTERAYVSRALARYADDMDDASLQFYRTLDEAGVVATTSGFLSRRNDERDKDEDRSAFVN